MKKSSPLTVEQVVVLDDCDPCILTMKYEIGSVGKFILYVVLVYRSG